MSNQIDKAAKLTVMNEMVKSLWLRGLITEVEMSKAIERLNENYI